MNPTEAKLTYSAYIPIRQPIPHRSVRSPRMSISLGGTPCCATSLHLHITSTYCTLHQHDPAHPQPVPCNIRPTCHHTRTPGYPPRPPPPSAAHSNSPARSPASPQPTLIVPTCLTVSISIPLHPSAPPRPLAPLRAAPLSLPATRIILLIVPD